MNNNQPAVTYQLGSGSTALAIRGWDFPVSLAEQAPQGLRTGYEVERATREHVFPFRLTDLSGGFLATSGIYDAGQFRNRVYRNEGLMCHLPGVASLAYKSNSQAALDNIDISTFRAANKRVHAIMSTLGVSGARLLAAISTKVYIDTSTSNPALTLADDSLTDAVLSIANLKLNLTDYTAVSTDGTTNDTRGATDVTAATPWSSGTELVTHANANDGFFAMDFFPSLGGNGWNVFVGILNNTNGIWAYPNETTTLPITTTTMLPVVAKMGSDLPNTSNTILDTGFKFAGRGFEVFSYNGVALAASRWNDPNNLTADDDSFATTDANVDDIDTGIAGVNFDFQVPTNAQITGYTSRYRRKESDAAVNAVTAELLLFKGISNNATAGTAGTPTNFLGEIEAVGLNPVDMDTAEWSTTEEAIEDGGSTDLWGTSYTPADVNSADFGIVLFMRQAAVASQNASIDSFELKVHYRLPGTQFSLPQGGWQPGKPPHRANRMAYIAPVTDELTTVNKPRQVSFLDFEYDATGDRLLAGLSMPATQLAYVEDAEWFQGGLAVSGGSSSGPGVQVKLIDDDNVTRDLGFPAVHGSTAVRVAAMFRVGAVLMAWVCDNASTDNQLWMYYNGRWHAFGALFSKTLGGAMSTQPLGWAEKTLGTFQNQIYCIYPSGTNTAAMYQFVPPDPLNADPFLVNTSQSKQDGPLYVQTLELDVLPEEANKSITAIQAQSRRIDDKTTYGTLRVRVDTGGDATFASAEIDETFDATAELFVDRNIQSSGDPGVAFRSAIFRLTADNTASSTKTPNLLPILFYVVASWPPMKKFGITLAREQNLPPSALADKIEDLMNTKNTQRFMGGGNDCAVKVAGYEFKYIRGSLGAMPTSWEMVDSAVLMLAEVPGGTS